MVYRKTGLAATVALLVPALAPAAPLAVTEVRDDHKASLALADWSEAIAIRADLGEVDGQRLLLVELDPGTRAVLRAVGAPVRVIESEEDRRRPLYRVSGAGAVEHAMLPSLGDVIWASDEQVLVRTTEPEIWSLAGQGVRLHKISARAMTPPRETMSASGNAVAPEYPEVDDLVANVSGTSIAGYVDELVAFPTRHSNLQGGLDAQAYLKAKFESLGYTQVAELAVPGIPQRNVCATLPGVETPEKIFVVGGHYDSTATNTANAPGADDNASGTAGTLELARVMKAMQFKSTLVFCGYAGEELGLLGSAAHADALAGAGANVAGMINLDMIGHLSDGDAIDIDVASNGGSATMRSLFSDVVARYVAGSQEVNGQLPTGASSDHASFWQNGYPALMLFEDTGNYSPFIHTANDVPGTSFNSPDLAERIVRSTAAMLAVMAEPSAATTTEPTPTPTPGTDPADPADDEMETVHGSCMCSMESVGSATPSLFPALLALAAIGLRRRVRSA